MPHRPADVEPLSRIAHELRTIAGIIDKIAASPPKSEAGDHSKDLGQIREALGDIATALQHVVQRYSE